MSAAAPLAPVLEIGGTHVTAALVDPVEQAVLPGSARRLPLDGEGTAARTVEAILGCGAGLAAGTGLPWGVALPGPFDYEGGIALYTGVGKFDALHGTDLRAALMEGLPQRPGSVSFLNDADAFLVGEWLSGAAAGSSRCAGITLGTGVGSAFLADGTLREEGPGVPPEGRVDLLEIAGRPLEDVVSRRALRAAYLRLAGQDRAAPASGANAAGPPDVDGIAALAAGGDPLAQSVLRTAFEALGETLGPRLRDFGATVLVVGGSITGSWELIGPMLRDGLMRTGGRDPEHLDVRVAARPDHAALIGAAWHAKSVAVQGKRGGFGKSTSAYNG
ncbi:ROK family protein [Streptomyces sp. NPDC049040]|uniref:ROK family protein n=1 Tax=Streptomyces sp. NPDC049040 TaxID=3365593 RepID=UPI003716BF0E